MQHTTHRTTRFGFALLAALVAACGDVTSPGAPGMNSDPATGVVITSPTPTAGNPLAGLALYVSTASSAKLQADSWRASRPADAAIMDKIAAQPQAAWFGGWNSDIRADVNRVVSSANASGAVPVLVAYNIPQRDCGSYSAGGANSPSGYRSWIADFAAGIAGRKSLVLLEPDALAGMDCLSSADQDTRTSLLSYAVQTLRSVGATAVYIDAGHSHWQSVATMAARLAKSGIEWANGFSLNISNFHYTNEQITYGDAISSLVGGQHYIVDTGRNGLGSAGDAAWCNPAGRALGIKPTVATGYALVDAFLWVKTPGESDGACNGAPEAGAWMPEYALGLAQRAGY